MAKPGKKPARKKPPIILLYGQGEKAGGLLRGVPPVHAHGEHPKPGVLMADDWAKSGMWAMVSSSNVAAIAYDDKEKLLYVMFQVKEGAPPVWAYRGVDVFKAKDMFNCNSMGSFVHQRLRNKHPERRIR